MIRVIHLATAVAVAMVALATLAKADFCMWCDPVISQNFLLCVGGKIMNDPRFSASAEALDDMKSSMIAASKAMKKSSESTKMNMMNGAMAGELAELIKYQTSVGNLKETTSYLLGIVRDCYVQTSGQPHYSFMTDIGKMVYFMLNDDSPPFEDSESKPVPLQPPVQTLASPAVYSAQNNMIPNNNAQQIPSDSNVFIPNQIYVPPQSGIAPEVSLTYPQTGPLYPAEFANSKGETAAFSLNYPASNNNNGPFIRTGPDNQMPSTQINAESRYEIFQQNKLPNTAPDQNKWSNFVPYIDASQNNVANIGASIISPNRLLPQDTAPISNAESSSAEQNINTARPWTIFGASLPNIRLDQFLPQTNQPVSNAAPGYNSDYRRNAQNFISQPALPQSSSAVTTFTSQDKGYPLYYPQNQLVQNFNANEGGQKGAYPLNMVNNSPDQITDDASTDYEHQPDYDYYSHYPASSDTYNSNQPPQPASQNLNWNYPPLTGVKKYPLPNNANNPVNIVQSSSKNEPQQNYGDQPQRDIPQKSISSTLPLVKSVNIQGTDSGGIGFLSDGSQPNNATAATPKENGKNSVSQPESVPKLGKWTIVKSKAKSGAQKSSSDENDDIAKAMRFAKTVYLLCYQSRKFKSVFNKHISTNKAASYTYKIIRGALKNCGYLKNAEEIAKSCSNTVKSLPQKCPYLRYAEVISKSLMDEFYTKGLLGENPENQAKSITTAFLARLKKKNSSGSEKLTNKSNRGSTASTSSDSLPDYLTDDRAQSSGYESFQDYPKATDDMRKENYGDYPYYDDLPEQGSGDKNSDDDSTGNQDSAVIDSYYNEYHNYPNPTTDFQYPIKTNQPKAIQTAKKKENPKEKSLEETVSNTGYNYQIYGDHPNSRKNNDQNQKSTGKIPSDNLKYDYYNQNYNYDPNYDYNNQNNDYYYQYYGNYDNFNAKPNKQPAEPDDYFGQSTDYYNPRNENNFPQSMNPDYYKYSGPNKKQPQAQKSSASASSLSVTQKRKEGNAKDGMKIENAKTESPTVNDCSDTTEEYIDYAQTYPDYGITLKNNDMNDIQPEKIELLDSTTNEDGKKSYSDTALSNPNDEKAERKNRLNILMEWALSSISDGKFNYKVYSNVISTIAKYLQRTHPEWGSQKCFITILIESLVACTQLLTQIPREYLAKMSVPDYIDTADETMANWSTNSLKQESQDSVQPDQRNSAQNVQTYEEPQKNKWNNGYQMSQTNPPPSVLNDNAAQSGHGNSFVDSNSKKLNIPLTNQGHQVANIPQTGGGGVQVAPSSQGYKDLPQQNNWNNKYQLKQGSLFLPGLNNMQQGYGNKFMDTNLNDYYQLPRQESWISSVPQTGEESLIAPSSHDDYKGLTQQNNWNYDYQSSQRNSFHPELINNKQQSYGNRFLDSNLNEQLPGQGG